MCRAKSLLYFIVVSFMWTEIGLRCSCMKIYKRYFQFQFCIFNSFNVVIELCGTKAVDRAQLIFMLVAEHLRDFQARIEIMKTLCYVQTRQKHKGANNFLILFQINFVIEATYSFY